MTLTYTPRLHLPQWDSDTDEVDYRVMFDAAFATLEDRVARDSQGLLADRPADADGVRGQFWTVTSGPSAGVIFRHDGSAWRELLISAAPAGSAVGDTAAAGTATSWARSDHRHAREAFGLPVASAVGATQAAGTAVTVARSDHRHAREAFASPADVGFAPGDGAASTVPRSDHVHRLPWNVPRGIIYQANIVGTLGPFTAAHQVLNRTVLDLLVARTYEVLFTIPVVDDESAVPNGQPSGSVDLWLRSAPGGTTSSPSNATLLAATPAGGQQVPLLGNSTNYAAGATVVGYVVTTGTLADLDAGTTVTTTIALTGMANVATSWRGLGLASTAVRIIVKDVGVGSLSFPL